MGEEIGEQTHDDEGVQEAVFDGLLHFGDYVWVFTNLKDQDKYLARKVKADDDKNGEEDEFSEDVYFGLWRIKIVLREDYEVFWVVVSVVDEVYGPYIELMTLPRDKMTVKAVLSFFDP